MYCAKHPGVETYLRCGKCGKPICTRCIVQTPVGARCRQCAGLRKLPQFEVSPWLLGRSAAAGLGASFVTWLLISILPYLRFFLSILVGFAVGEVMSRLAQRRSNRYLEVAAVLAVVIGLLLSRTF